MKFKLFKWSIRLYDLLVFAFLVGYFFHKPFRVLFDNSPYIVKAGAWLVVVLFFYYSVASWYHVIKRSMVSVLAREEGLIPEEDEEKPVVGGCDFVTGSKEEGE